MRCSACGVDAMIGRSYVTVQGDQSPDTKTQVYTVQEIICRNPRCKRHGEVVETVKNLDYEG